MVSACCWPYFSNSCLLFLLLLLPSPASVTVHRQRQHQHPPPSGNDRQKEGREDNNPSSSSTARRSLPNYPIISCYSCASEDYEPLFLRSASVHLFGQPLLFDRLCDSAVDLASFGSTIPCDSNCVSVLEPQYFGGIQNERKPFTFVRGCASDVFATATTTSATAVSGPEGIPAELEYLQRERMCMELAIGQIWPELGNTNSREMVRVCSCGTDGCNTHESATSGGDASSIGRLVSPMMMLIALAIIVMIPLMNMPSSNNNISPTIRRLLL